MFTAPNPNHTYHAIWKDSQKVNWQVDDLIGGDKQLDFTKCFLPEAIAHTQSIQCLRRDEKRILNQIRGNSYLHLFVLVERFIIPMVVEQVQRKGYDDVYAVRALLNFVEEEGKHIHLFQRFAEEFRQGFGVPCRCIDSVDQIVSYILQHHPLTVLFMTLHIEWMTQSHYLESVRDNREEKLDPLFCSLLKNHWLEEAQHTKLDILLAYEVAKQMDATEIEAAVQGYLTIIQFLEKGLMAQVQLDLEALSSSLSRSFTDAEKQEIQSVQEQSYRWAYLCSGLTHSNFLQIVHDLSPAAKTQVIEMAKRLS